MSKQNPRSYVARTLTSLALCGLLGLLSGCSVFSTRDRIHRLEQENLELSQTKNRLESALAACEGEQQTFGSEITRLQGELATANQRIRLQGASFRAADPEEDEADDEGVAMLDNVPGVSAIRDKSGEIRLTVDNSILFAAGKAKVSKDGESTLRQVSGIVAARYPTGFIRVVGHTDSQPIKKSPFASNWELSTARACSVLRQLISGGAVSSDRICATGFADQRPVADNNSKDGRAANRRVEIFVTQ